MATIDWAVVCGHAFFDQHNKPCIIGIIQRLHVPQVPVLVKQLVVVAHLADIPRVDEISVTVVMNTPGGFVSSPQRPDAFGVDAVDEYILATLYDVPLEEEGNYEFEISLRGQQPVKIRVPVSTVQDRPPFEVH